MTEWTDYAKHYERKPEVNQEFLQFYNLSMARDRIRAHADAYRKEYKFAEQLFSAYMLGLEKFIEKNAPGKETVEQLVDKIRPYHHEAEQKRANYATSLRMLRETRSEIAKILTASNLQRAA